ncbi:MAG: iron-sulfur cluster assembly accessory protein [Saprospiraceae bacterium]|jgi:iron-sulfur cluster assembly protein|nr:iron-sulfur cluster assembly accessory protein [Saprospiraceae bacterium]
MQTETILEAPLSISDAAIKQLERIKNEQQIPDSHGLRVGVKGGGCSGFSYVMGFDLAQEKDQIFEIGGFKVLMDKAHSLYLVGMQIDWVEGLNNRGFTFVNPNAKDTCGCGQSFSA